MPVVGAAWNESDESESDDVLTHRADPQAGFFVLHDPAIVAQTRQTIADEAESTRDLMEKVHQTVQTEVSRPRCCRARVFAYV